MEEQEIEVSEASGPRPIDQSIEEPPPPPQEGGAVEVEIGGAETMDCSPPSGSPSLPLPAGAPQETEGAPVFDQAVAPGPNHDQEGDESSEVCRPQSTDQSVEERQMLPESGAVEDVIGATNTMDCSQPVGTPPMSPSGSAPQKAEEVLVFYQSAAPGSTSDQGGDEALEVYRRQSIDQLSQGEEAGSILYEEQEGKTLEAGFGAHQVDDSQPLGSSAAAQSESVEVGKEAAAIEPAATHEMDDSQPLGSSEAPQSDSDEVGKEAAAIEPAATHEMDDSQPLGSSEAPQSDSDEVGKEAAAIEPAATYEMDDSQPLGSSEAPQSDSDEVGKEAAAIEPAATHEMDDSQPLGSSEAPQSDSDEVGKEAAAIEPAATHEMDDSQFLGSSARPHSTSAVEDNEDDTFKASTVVASHEPSEGKEASILQCEEGERRTVSSGVGAPEIDESQLSGFPSSPSEEDEEAPILEPSATGGFTINADDDQAGEDEVQMDEEAPEPMVDAAPRGRVGGRGRRKRGRPPSGQPARAPAKRRKEKEKEDEELCFICFDGGDLVVCDRRGCPKVYHPSCVNRDEAFFRAKGRWNCGWHICSNCEKSAQFMCYTCTFSLCKGCISEAGFVRVRGNKGFCVTCMSTVMLIESNEDGSKKVDGIDFDDKSSWMSFFKDYWLDLKRKLSLTLEELTRAKTPWKESNTISRNESSDDLHNANDGHEASSDSSSGRLRRSISSRKKAKKRSRNIANEEGSVKAAESEGTSTSEDINWATNELLELVAHMKDGDRSALSQFDVQALLLEYIKRNNLRDPRRKSHIICDSRLQNLFGKTRVGHFEMLKLIELHILTKEPSPVVTDDNQEGVVDPDPSQMETEGISDASTKLTSDRRRKTRKRVHEKELQINLDDYAAINVHNINLMYLRRNLMEDLLDNIDTFSEKVFGSFVRIRISGSGQRQDMYRLVQVVGTASTAKKYRTGKKTTDVTLEILNLDKTEFITIDVISNQEFTEEECKRLRQSIKCGFISRMTVGEVQEKARVLHAVRVNDWLESEKLRLGNLRDRASEKGRRKELRECVEKLQLLSTREERMRRLNEVPEIHADPKMDPDYETSEDDEEPDDKIQDNSGYARESSFSRKGSDGISPVKGGGSIPSNNWNNAWDLGSSTSADNRTNQSLNQVVHQASSSDAQNPPTNAIGLEVGALNNSQSVVKSGQSSVVPSETTTASLSTEVAAPSTISDTEKMWHYQDPAGKVQGPFSMTQLRKWNTSKYFPPSLRIWRTSETHEGSILLADALIGKFQKDLPQLEPQYNSTAQPTKVAAMMDTSSSWADSNQNAANWKGNRNDASSSSAGNNELARTDMRAAQPSAWSAPRSEVANQNEGRVGAPTGGWQSSNDTNAWSRQPQGHNSSRSVAPFSGNSSRPQPYQGSGGRGRNAGRWSGGQDYQNNWSANRSGAPQGNGMQHPNWSSSSQQSAGGHWNNQPANSSSNQWRNDSNNSSTPQPSSGGWTGVQGAFNNPSPPVAPVQPMSSGWVTTPRGNEAVQPSTATQGSNVAALTASSVGGWVSNPLPDPQLVSALQLPRGNEMITQKSATDLSGSASIVFRNGPDTNQSLESACLGPNPTFQQGASDVRSLSQSNERQDLHATSTNIESNPKLDTASSEAHQPNLLHHGLAETKPAVVSNALEGIEATSDPKQEPGGSIANPASAANLEEPTRSLKPEQSLSGSKPLKSGNSEVSAEKNSNERPMQSRRPSRWDTSADSTSGNKQPTHLVSPNSSQLPTSSQWKASTAPSTVTGPAQPSNSGVGVAPQNPSVGTGPAQVNSNMGWGPQGPAQPSNSGLGVAPQNPSTVTGPPQGNSIMIQPAQPPSSGLGVVPQNPSTVAGPAQGSSNAIWGPAMQGTTNVGWGVVAPGNVNVVWGIPAQGNPNLSVGWGTPVQANQNTNANMAWGTPAQGNTNSNAGWVAPVQTNATVNPNWVAPAQGNPNPNLGSGPQTMGSTSQNVSWGAPVDGSSNNVNAGWGAGQGNMNPNWNPSAVNPNGSNVQQNQGGDAGHGGGRQSWSGGGGGGPSRSGVCRFHESGHCKKGANCNYIHQ